MNQLKTSNDIIILISMVNGGKYHKIHENAVESTIRSEAKLNQALNNIYETVGCMLWSTHQKSPPAPYFVREYQVSPGCVAMLEWRKTAEGRSAVAPAGNSIMSFRYKVPAVGVSKLPSVVMAHRPNGRLTGFIWSNVHVTGPKLTVTQRVTTVSEVSMQIGAGLKERV